MSNVLPESSLKSSEETKEPIGKLSEAIGNLSVKGYSDKSTQTKLPLNISDLPIDAVSLIIEKSEYKEQLILRKVSKSMRSLVDKSIPACKSVLFECNPHYIRCRYNNQSVAYAANRKYKRSYHYYPDKSVNVFKDNYESVAFDDLARTFSNPKLQLDRLFFKHSYKHEDDDDDGQPLEFPFAGIEKKMETILNSLNHQISVKQFSVESDDLSSFRAILPYLKPGVLKLVCLRFRRYDSDTLLKIGEISSFDQWKHAQELKLYYDDPINLMKYATHFKRFDMNLMGVGKSQLISLRSHFSRMDNFEYCSIGFGYCNSDIQSLVMAVGIPASPNEKTIFVSHHSIPNSKNYLEFLFSQNRIIIQKKNRIKNST